MSISFTLCDNSIGKCRRDQAGLYLLRLSDLPDCDVQMGSQAPKTHSVLFAQAAGGGIQGRLDSALDGLTVAERALKALEQQMEALQAAHPTGAAAVSRTVTTGAGSSAQKGTKRAANRDGNSFISPNAQKKKPRRSPALLPKGILQKDK